MVAYQKYLRGETPVKPIAPTEEPVAVDSLPGKKKYIPPYTPNRTKSFGTGMPKEFFKKKLFKKFLKKFL
jgi:hypothetical protein